jgi:hypothetical protein
MEVKFKYMNEEREIQKERSIPAHHFLLSRLCPSLASLGVYQQQSYLLFSIPAKGWSFVYEMGMTLKIRREYRNKGENLPFFLL